MNGIIGGLGCMSELFDQARHDKVGTPRGEPSSPGTVAAAACWQVAFLARHGADHRFLAYRIPYRANLWALRAVGCWRILAPCAGSGLVPQQMLPATVTAFPQERRCCCGKALDGMTPPYALP